MPESPVTTPSYTTPWDTIPYSGRGDLVKRNILPNNVCDGV
jgi:hypothetical protein